MEEQKQQNPASREGEFQTDTQRLMRKHMADQNHVITDEDLAKVRVGMSPGPDEPTKEAIKEADDRIADKKTLNEDETLPGAQKITPWDVTT